MWQCHGTMVDTPCSRVGHIYRCKYIPFPNPGIGDFISRNYRRYISVFCAKKITVVKQWDFEFIDQ